MLIAYINHILKELYIWNHLAEVINLENNWIFEKVHLLSSIQKYSNRFAYIKVRIFSIFLAINGEKRENNIYPKIYLVGIFSFLSSTYDN